MAMNSIVQAKEPEPALPPMRELRFHQARMSELQAEVKVRNNWCLQVPTHCAPESLLEPDYFATVAYKFSPRDVLHCFAVDGSWYSEVLVLECGPGHARTTILRTVGLPQITPQTAGVPKGHEILFLGPVDLWGAKRGAQILKKGFLTEAAAFEWLVALNG